MAVDSSRFSAVRASPLARRAIASSASSSTSTASPPRPRSASESARCRMLWIASRSRAFSTNTCDRESSAELTSNEGFSVVAPIEDDVAGLDAGQEGVLLRLVEAVNLVDEQDRPPPELSPRLLGLGHHRLDLLDARQHGAEGDEVRAGDLRDEAGERRLAGARGAPEDDRLQQVALDRHAQRPARREQVLLPDQFVEAARPHAVGEGRPHAASSWAGRGLVVEQLAAQGALLAARGARGPAPARCRRASYTSSAAATATLSDSTGDAIGMATATSAAATASAASPGPSPPSRKAVGAVKSAS